MKWKSSNTSVAAVNAAGVVKGVDAGTCTITASSSYREKASIKITVTKAAADAKDQQKQDEVSAARTDKPLDPAKAPTLKKKEKEILNSKKEEAPAGSAFNLLQLRAVKVTKNSVKIRWTKVKGADGYVIYGAKCGQKYKKLKTIKKGSTVSWTQKKLKKGKYYKYYIVATAKYKGTKKVIAASKTIHIATAGGKVGNFKSVKLTNVKKNKVSLRVGKKFTIKAKTAAASKKQKVKNHRGLAYESTNPAIASVSRKGKITAKAAGTCYVYVYAQNGLFSRMKVTVK